MSCLIFALVSLAQTDLQERIDAAAPGAVIRFTGRHGPVRIEKPLTLLGDGRTSWIAEDPDNPILSPVHLAGPGHGTVRLVGVRVESGGVFAGFYGDVAPTISGSGFAELELITCQVRPGDFRGDTSVGAAAIDVLDLARVRIVDSKVSAAKADGYRATCCATGGPPGILAPSAVVELHRSTVRGADAGQNVTPWPCGEFDVTGGNGGPGVRAARVHVSESDVRGGRGSTWIDSLGAPCTPSPDGPAIVELDPTRGPGSPGRTARR